MATPQEQLLGVLQQGQALQQDVANRAFAEAQANMRQATALEAARQAAELQRDFTANQNLLQRQMQVEQAELDRELQREELQLLSDRNKMEHQAAIASVNQRHAEGLYNTVASVRRRIDNIFRNAGVDPITGRVDLNATEREEVLKLQQQLQESEKNWVDFMNRTSPTGEKLSLPEGKELLSNRYDTELAQRQLSQAKLERFGVTPVTTTADVIEEQPIETPSTMLSPGPPVRAFGFGGAVPKRQVNVGTEEVRLPLSDQVQALSKSRIEQQREQQRQRQALLQTQAQ